MSNLHAKPNRNFSTPCLNDGTQLEQGQYYSDDKNIYVLFGVNEKEVAVYKNPPAGMLWSDIFKLQKEVHIPLSEFLKYHVYSNYDKQ